MKSVRNSFFVMFLSMFFCGCNLGSQEAIPVSVELYWNFETAEWAAEPTLYQVQEDGVFAEHIAKLLKQHAEGWRLSFVSYLPHIRVVAENRMYVLNITPELLVVNCKKNADDVRMDQRVKKISRRVYLETLDLIKETESGLNIQY